MITKIFNFIFLLLFLILNNPISTSASELDKSRKPYKRLNGDIIQKYAQPSLKDDTDYISGMEHLRLLYQKIKKSGYATSSDLEQSLAYIADFVELLMSGRLKYSKKKSKIYGIRTSTPTKDEWHDLVKISGFISQYLNRAFMSKNKKLKDRITQRIFIHAFMSLNEIERDNPKYQRHSLGALALLCAGGAAAHDKSEWKKCVRDFIQIGIDEAKRLGDSHTRNYMDKLQIYFDKVTAKQLDAFLNQKGVDFYTVAGEGIKEY